MKLTFIDHYDSFSFNVLDWLRRASDNSLDITRITCDDDTGLARLKNSPTPVVISPGPGHPTDYPKTISSIKSLLGKAPILGVCLGHQMLGHIAGLKIIPAIDPWHGTLLRISKVHENWLTTGLPNEFQAVVYNSLVIDVKPDVAGEWVPAAMDNKNQLMMMTHRELPIGSVQFHPESFASTGLDRIARNFLVKCGV